jgi:CRP/FNR family cyclic AMP-dependent transcriptional regulator
MKTILLIEDNDDIRENMAEILELANYKVVTAADGKQGVAMAFEHKPDLIVCDIMMPVLDGYGVLHMIQKNEALSSVPFIFMTAKAERSEVRKGMEMGADDYITKPFNGTELLNAVESRLKKTELLRKQFSADLQGLNNLIETSSGQQQLQELIRDRSTNIYKKKQVIYSEGNHALRLYYVERGKVKTYKTNDDGKELIIGLYNDGDFLGYNPLLEGTDYRETAEALEETELVLIPRSEFEMLLNHNPQVMQQFVRMLARNVSEKEEQLLNLAYNSLRKKVAEALVKLAEKYGAGQAEGFSIAISRENLANIAGTAKESLIRTISDFKDEKLIDIQGGTIIILNPKKLKQMIN